MQTSITTSIQQGDLAKFFAWARERAYVEFEKRMAADPQLDPNWTFSDIMQELLAQYQSGAPASLQASSN
jgi:hypothetical protein